MANVMEIELRQHLAEAALLTPSAAVADGTERSYPDLEFSGDMFGGGFRAVDIKCARRKVSKSGRTPTTLNNRIALYTADGRYREQALFMSGEAYYKAGKFYRAYLAYDEYLSVYSRSERVKYVIQQLADCGFKLMGGAKKEILGLPILPGEGTGTEIVKHVIEKYPYEEGSDQFHYLLINHYIDEEDFEQATLEADLFLTTYPKSQWTPTVQFQKGAAQLAAHQGVAYDPTPLHDARKSFQDYLEKNPNGDRTQEAKERLSEIDDKQAQKDFEVADFYRRTGHPDSARVYFEMVIRRYPNTSWSQKAQAELEALK